MAQHPAQTSVVEARHGVPSTLQAACQSAGRFVRAQQMAAHHGGQGQREKRGDPDGDGQRDGKLAEQPAHDAAHEKQGDQHRDQRHGQRDDGEADLARALERGLDGRQTLLDVACDVLDHDDGVVDHEAGGDGQRHQGQVVEAVAAQLHDAEGGDERQGNRHAGNDGGAKRAQKRYITPTTRRMVRTRVNCTSSTEARTVSVRSEMMAMSMPLGMEAPVAEGGPSRFP